jgi:hypothetical protein
MRNRRFTATDSIADDPSTFEIVVWDAGYAAGGRFPSGQVPASLGSSHGA